MSANIFGHLLPTYLFRHFIPKDIKCLIRYNSNISTKIAWQFVTCRKILNGERNIAKSSNLEIIKHKCVQNIETNSAKLFYLVLSCLKHVSSCFYVKKSKHPLGTPSLYEGMVSLSRQRHISIFLDMLMHHK